MSGRVWKRGNRWMAILELGRDSEGKRRTRWKAFPTKSSARSWVAEQGERLRTATYIPDSRQTLGSFLAEWLDAISTTVRPVTLDSYRRLMNTHVVPRIGMIPLQQLGAPHLNRLYAVMLTSGNTRGSSGGGLSPRTVRYVHSIVHRALRDAVRWDLLVRNAADQADPPRAQTPEMRSWDAEQLGAFLSHVGSDRLFPLWLVAASTGARRGELLALRWSDMSFSPPRMEISRTLTSIAYRLSFSEPKTKRSRRSVPLDAQTASVLRSWKAVQAEEKMALGAAYSDQGLVFANPMGEPIHPDRMTQMFSAHVRKAGLPRISLHGLRHSHASILLRAGVHPKVVQQRLGHSTVALTLDTYSHLIPAMEEEAAELGAALVFGGGQ